MNGLLALFDLPKLQRSVGLALRSLWLHKLRSFLSVLGIIIGTGAVIALMAFGEGSRQAALDVIRRQGATNIIVRSVKPPSDANARTTFIARYGLTKADYERFATINSITRLVPMRIFPQEVRRLGKVTTGRIVGTTPGYSEIHTLKLTAGRFLMDEDEYFSRDVCVLGAAVADRLFPYDEPLGQEVVIRGSDYRVVGVLAERTPLSGGGNSSQNTMEDFDYDVYIPLQTCRLRFGAVIFMRSSGSRSGEQVELHQITATVDAEIESRRGREQIKAVGDLIRQMLDERKERKADVSVTVPLDQLEQAEKTQEILKQLLVIIAGISLLVGGIGIMNIMLATVTERTREIGIRRALGAKRRDITMQFLIEAIVQTTLGGLAGVLLGLTAAYVLPPVLAWYWPQLSLPAQVLPESVFLSLGVSVGVGVLFGWFPAQRAARLDPIEALRHD